MQKILVPLDGSAFAERATDTARALAARTGATLEFIVVHDPVLPPARVSGAPILDPQLDNEVRAGQRAYLERLVIAEQGRGTIPVNGSLLEGRPAEQIATHAAESAADIIVMTTHGRGGFERFWLGSVADGVVRKGTTPVLLVREESGPAAGGGAELNRVVVALAGSDQDDPVTQVVLDVTDPVRAEYTLIHVVIPASALPVHPTLGPPPDELAGVPADVDVRQRADATSYLELMARPFRERAVAVDIHVERAGNPARAVVTLAERKKANLIAVGTAGRGPVSRLFMGSVADKIIRGASCSVLVVPSKGTK